MSTGFEGLGVDTMQRAVAVMQALRPHLTEAIEATRAGQHYVVPEAPIDWQMAVGEQGFDDSLTVGLLVVANTLRDFYIHATGIDPIPVLAMQYAKAAGE